MRLAELVAASRAVAAASARLQKIDLLAGLLRRVPPAEIDIAVALLSGTIRQGRIGIGFALLSAARSAHAASEATLDLVEVDATFAAIAGVTGPGAGAARAEQLRALLARASSDEQDYLVALLSGGLRQGALEGLLLEAVARASGVPAATLRRAVMIAGALAPVARSALLEGERGVTGVVLRPFQPVQPMLAESAPGIAEAWADLGPCALEFKLDGARIQVHKVGEEVRVFSRSLRDVTAAVPEVVDAVRVLEAREIVLDGEAIALRPDRTPEPFQVTMRRFGRRLEVERLRDEIPIFPFFFDCLYLDGDLLIDEPLSRRTALLDSLAPPAIVVPRIVAARPEDAPEFAARAAAAGHEGVMAKALASSYAAGRRGAAWLKVKQARTLDLVVLGVEWGSGRRQGWLSNLHLGARDAQRGGFVMLGKTFKGLTDAMLDWQTRALLALETGRDRHVVFVRPELVVEVAFNDIQLSSQYPGGLALRFARVKRHRPDKSAAEADTFETVQAIFRQMTGLDAPAR
jgi:DNA ligase-1